MTTDLKTIAEQAATAIRNVAQIKGELLTVEYHAQRRAIELTPAEGWPGKNEDARKTAQAAAEMADDQLASYRKDIRRLYAQLYEQEAERDAARVVLHAAWIANQTQPIPF